MERRKYPITGDEHDYLHCFIQKDDTLSETYSLRCCYHFVCSLYNKSVLLHDQYPLYLRFTDNPLYVHQLLKKQN